MQWNQRQHVHLFYVAYGHGLRGTDRASPHTGTEEAPLKAAEGTCIYQSDVQAFERMRQRVGRDACSQNGILACIKSTQLPRLTSPGAGCIWHRRASL